MNILVMFEGKRTDKALSQEAKLLSFGLKDITTSTVIEGDKVTLTVPKADADKINSALAEVEISDKATISPALNIIQDFSEPIEYTVTAEDGKTKATYTVTTLIEASSEAQVLTFGLKGVNVLSSIVGVDTVKLIVDAVDADKIKNAIPTATLSAGATISPDLDITQDFSEVVEYVITAEDGLTQSTYKVLVILFKQPKVITFDFSTSTEKYKEKKSKNNSALPVDTDNFKWDSSDGGVVQLFGFFVKRGEKFGITHNGGPSFSIETLNTKGKDPILSFPATPVITSGSLFLGSFALNTKEPLKSTAFGVVVDNKPLKVAGTANYKTGEEYYYCPNPTAKESHKVERVVGKKDEGLISAIVYEVTAGVATLDGTNINDHPNVVGKTQHILVDGDNGDFSFDIEYTKDFDPAKTYKLALILSASKDGDKFSGAGGSVLTVSKLEVVLE